MKEFPQAPYASRLRKGAGFAGALRLMAHGEGENDPVGSRNDSETGSQQNRSVKVIIANSPAGSR